MVIFELSPLSFGAFFDTGVFSEADLTGKIERVK